MKDGDDPLIESEGEDFESDEEKEVEGFALGDVVIPVDKVKDFIDPEAVLVNNVDGYVGKYVAQFLSERHVHEKDDDAGEDELDGEDGERLYWKVLGVIKDKKNSIPPFLWAVMRNDDFDAYIKEALKCSVIIYDVTEDTTQERMDEIRSVCDALRARVPTFASRRVFILISSLHTWSHTKRHDEGISFTEDDYRRRRTRPLYRELQLLERYVVASGKMTKGMLKAYVIGAGAVYGEEESPLHHWFKSAWHNAKYLPIYGLGKNVVPTIYIKDLALVIQNVMDKTPRKQRYIIAVDPVLCKQDQIAKVISDSLGTGRIKRLPESEIYLNRELESFQADQLLLNLPIESSFCRDTFNIIPEAIGGFGDIIDKLSAEYRKGRGLEPLKVIIVGKPGSGKSLVARQISDLYRLNHFTKKEIIESTIEMMRGIAGDLIDTDIIGVDEEREESVKETAKGILFEIDESEVENGFISDEVFIKLVKFRLLSNHCKNQGWILDGFPENYDQGAWLLYKEREDDDEAEQDGDDDSEDPTNTLLDNRFMPDHASVFEANDEYLIERLQAIPSSQLDERHTEAMYPLVLQEYKDRNTDYETSFQYFMDEQEILYFPIDVEVDKSAMMQTTVFRISNTIGRPRNYGLTVEEENALKNAQTFEQTHIDFKEKEDLAHIESMELEERRKNIQLWMEKLAKVKREEFEKEEASLIPLRHYLMAHVVPTLTKGLVEVTRARPQDPLDFLAEFLFQNNPGGINPTGENLTNTT